MLPKDFAHPCLIPLTVIVERRRAGENFVIYITCTLPKQFNNKFLIATEYLGVDYVYEVIVLYLLLSHSIEKRWSF